MNLGVAGVAISTVTARLVALLVALVCFYKYKIGKISLKYLFPFPFAMLGQMVKIGLPSAGENLCYNMYQMVLLSIVNRMGNDAVNAQVYCKSLISFSMVFSNACAMATQIIISPYTLRIFTSNEVIIKMSFMIMFVDIFVEIGRCMNMTVVSSLKAAGDYVFPLLIGVVTMWGLGATLGYTFGSVLALGVAGVFIGTASDECIRGFVVLYRWYKKKWLGKAIVKSDETVVEE